MYQNLLSILNNLLSISDHNGIITIDSGINSQDIVSIVALTHGNEVAGLYLFDYLINEFNIKNKIKKGTLQLILGNYEAFLRKTDDERLSLRYIDRDFNRVWGGDGVGVEYTRRDKIKNYIDKSIALLDIHSTSMPSTPMIIPASSNTSTKSFIENMKGDFIIDNLMNYLNGIPLAKYHSNLNTENISLVVECGQHFTQETIETARYNSLLFLDYLGLIDFSVEVISKPKFLSVFECYQARSLEIEYIYKEIPSSFDFIKKGEIIAKVGEEPLTCSEDSYIVMPTKKLTYLNEEVWYLAKESNI